MDLEEDLVDWLVSDRKCARETINLIVDLVN